MKVEVASKRFNRKVFPHDLQNGLGIFFFKCAINISERWHVINSVSNELMMLFYEWIA